MRFSTSTSLCLLTLAATLSVSASPIRRPRASLDPSVKCPSADKDGTPLTASEVGPEDGFATCTYEDAGACEYFAGDGSFSSGSSTCPKGVPQGADFGKAAAKKETSTLLKAMGTMMMDGEKKTTMMMEEPPMKTTRTMMEPPMRTTTTMMEEKKTTMMGEKKTTMMEEKKTTMMEEKKTTRTMMEPPMKTLTMDNPLMKTTTMMDDEKKTTTTMMEEKSTSTSESSTILGRTSTSSLPFIGSLSTSTSTSTSTLPFIGSLSTSTPQNPTATSILFDKAAAPTGISLESNSDSPAAPKVNANANGGVASLRGPSAALVVALLVGAAALL